MNRKLQFQGFLVLAGMAAAALTPMAARSAPPEPSAVTVTVTAVGKKGAPLAQLRETMCSRIKAKNASRWLTGGAAKRSS